MRRETCAERPGWQDEVAARGLIWHTAGDQPYWHEGVFYRFGAAEIAEIEQATAELYRLFVAAGQAVIDDDELLARFGIPAYAHDAIRSAWEAEPPALNYGRFDLGYDGNGPPKLFEFNCDTPTSLLEAAVIQWDWKDAVFPAADQFNSLHDRLVARWREIAPHLPSRHVHFAHVADVSGEDTMTVAYLRDTARAAGIASTPLRVDQIGWDRTGGRFVDDASLPITAIFKLYPWEWLLAEGFGPNLIATLPVTVWIEPIWKMIWSNKAILPVLWGMFPDHENLLGARYSRPPDGVDHVRKPMLGREGANVELVRAGAVATTGGGYGEEGFIYQSAFALPETAPGCFPVIGSWVVDGAPAGMGIREDGLITGNKARFVPHVVDGG